MKHILKITKPALVVLLTATSVAIWAQYSITAGEYASISKPSGGVPEVRLRFSVSQSSGVNWTVKGSWYTFDKRGYPKGHSFAGTLYASTGRVALRFTFPKEMVNKGRIDGTFQPSTGIIQMKVWVPVDPKGEVDPKSQKLALLTYDCENKASKPGAAPGAAVWKLKDGWPKPNEHLDWHHKNTRNRIGGGKITFLPTEAVVLQWSYTEPPEQLVVGQTYRLSIQGISTTHPGPPHPVSHVGIGVDARNVTSPLDGQGIYRERNMSHGVIPPPLRPDYGNNPTADSIDFVFQPDSSSQSFRVWVALPVAGIPLLIYEYEPVQRPKRAAAPPPAKPGKEPADKPAVDKPAGDKGVKPPGDSGSATVGSTPKSPTLRVISVKGDVQVKHPNSNEWVDFDPAVPLKVGDTISTGAEEEIELALPDGETLRMDPMSTIKVGPLLGGKGQRTRAVMDMIHGRIFVRRLPGFGDFSRSSFEVRRPTATISVRGTEYSVFWDDKVKMLQVQVTEGEVTISIKGETAPIVLKQGETWVRKFPD